jgi:hypothetical protein
LEDFAQLFCVKSPMRQVHKTLSYWYWAYYFRQVICFHTKQTNEAEAKQPGRSKLHRAARFAILTERWPGWPPLLIFGGS